MEAGDKAEIQNREVIAYSFLRAALIQNSPLKATIKKRAYRSKNVGSVPY